MRWVSRFHWPWGGQGPKQPQSAVGGRPEPPPENAALHVTELLITQAQWELSVQIQAGLSRGTQTLAFMTADLALVAILATLQASLGRAWWVPCLFLGVSAVCFASSAGAFRYQAGPELRAAFQIMQDAEPLEANARILAELLSAVEHNRTAPSGKKRRQGGFLFLILGVLAVLGIALGGVHAFSVTGGQSRGPVTPTPTPSSLGRPSPTPEPGTPGPTAPTP